MKREELLNTLKAIQHQFVNAGTKKSKSWDEAIFYLADRQHFFIGDHPELYKKLSTIWYSSRMASCELVLLSLDLLIKDEERKENK